MSTSAVVNAGKFDLTSQVTGILPVANGGSGTSLSYQCHAFINFDGTLSGTITPRASGNITSVVKNSTGVYTITMTTALSDANYVVCGTVGASGVVAIFRVYDDSVARTTTVFKIVVFNGSGTAVDVPYINLAVIR